MSRSKAHDVPDAMKRPHDDHIRRQLRQRRLITYDDMQQETEA